MTGIGNYNTGAAKLREAGGAVANTGAGGSFNPFGPTTNGSAAAAVTGLV
jgi:hypothetical protein